MICQRFSSYFFFLLLDSEVPCLVRTLDVWDHYAIVFGYFEGYALGLRFGISSAIPFVIFGRQIPPQPSLAHARLAQARPGHGQSSPTQPSTPGQARPAVPKAFSHWIQTHRFRPLNGSAFSPFLGCLGSPCRYVWLFWGVGSGISFWNFLQIILWSYGLGPCLCQRLTQGFLLPDSEVPFSARRWPHF